MTPGERAKHWAAAFMTLWPLWALVLGTLGYTNKDEIKGLMFTSDGQKIVGLTPFEQTMLNEIERIDLEEATGRAEVLAAINAINKKLASQDTINYRAHDKEIDALHKRMIVMEALVN